MKVKLIIAKSTSNTYFFNYGDDYSDITRILVEDHSPFEDVEISELNSLRDYVNDYNLINNKNGSFAFVIIKEEQISAKLAIAEIIEKRRVQAGELRQKLEREKLARKQKAEEAKKKASAKSIEKKRKQLEALKAELGEP